jgi:hypothetical protein
MTNLVEIGFTDSRVVCDLVGTRLAIPLAILVRCHGEDYPQFCYPMSRKTSNAVPTILSRGDFILCAMDIKEIRKQNFAALFADFERRQREANAKATLVEFGKQYALNHRHVSQIKNGSRDIGDAVARRLEQLHTPPLSPGWMDVQHGPGVPKDEVEEQLVEIMLTLYRQQPAEALKVIKELGQIKRG